MVKNTDMISEITDKLLNILDSDITYVFNRENAKDLCEYYSDDNYYCVAGRCVMASAVFDLSYDPFVLEFISVGRDGSHSNYLIYQEGEKLLFQAEFPNSLRDVEPIIWKCCEGDWIRHLDKLIAFIYD